MPWPWGRNRATTQQPQSHHHGRTSSGFTEAQLYWIITVRADERPHEVPLVGVWHDGAFAFCTGREEQKQCNLDSNPQVAVTTSSTGANGWDSGKDVVVEGMAVRLTHAVALRSLAGAWFAKCGGDWRSGVSRAGVHRAQPLRWEYHGRRTGLPGRGRQGHRVRRRARPDDVSLLTLRPWLDGWIIGPSQHHRLRHTAGIRRPSEDAPSGGPRRSGPASAGHASRQLPCAATAPVLWGDAP
ncbi:MAG: pyridoxamine 5'-phosphate oxidase family protein [Nocardioidaceae bacterium]